MRFYLLCCLQAVRSELVFAGPFLAAVWYHKAGDPECPGEAKAPHKHFVGRFFVLTNILKNWNTAALLLGSGCFTEGRISTHV